MTNEEIKELEKELWGAADALRANSKLTAAEYKDPVLGLILLRYAQNRYEEAKKQLEKTIPINPRTKKRRDLNKDDFKGAGAIMLQPKSQYDYLVKLAGGEDICHIVNNAMKLIEADYKQLEGSLPQNYDTLEPSLLGSLLRIFEKDSVKNLKGDVFGRIYEYFLMKFSMIGAGAQEGGEFFTPPSLVQLIVNFIEPSNGIIFDPACGSGGMFIQTGYFIKNHSKKNVNEAITVHGTELKSNNVRLAKMNLAIHGIEGKIIEGNTFYADAHNLVGQCDFVMANPPFNVNKVDKSNKFVKNDSRLFEQVGIPKADNANYLWIQYFHSYLNQKGRAGFVMASSATDAGNTEKAIREALILTGDVDCIVSIGNNFFYTRSLPCHLWFFDKAKKKENKDKILMIDARNIFRVVNTTVNDFSPGQLNNLTTIIKLYRGEKNAFPNAIKLQENIGKGIFSNIHEKYNILYDELNQIATKLKDSSLKISKTISYSKFDSNSISEIIETFETPAKAAKEAILTLEKQIKTIEEQSKVNKEDKKKNSLKLKPLKEKYNQINRPLKEYLKETVEYIKDAKQLKSDWQQLLEYFPDGNYQDVEGLCKIATLDEVKENDYSLTPGRYVGYSIQIDENFDYQKRISEIHDELKDLNKEANSLMKKILAG